MRGKGTRRGSRKHPSKKDMSQAKKDMSHLDEPSSSSSRPTSLRPSPSRLYKSIRLVTQDSNDETEGSSGRITPEQHITKSAKDERREFYDTFQVFLAGSASREKHERGELLWLHLQAWIHGRPMKTRELIMHSTHEHDNYLVQQRDKLKSVFHEITRFRQRITSENSFISSMSGSMTAVEDSPTPSVSHSPNGPHNGKPQFELDSPANSPRSSKVSVPDVQLLFADNTLAPPGQQEIFCGAFLEKQKKELRIIGGILSKYEKFESYYPTTKTMEIQLGSDFPQTIRDRLNVLYVWYNITRDVCRKIRAVGEMLGMNKQSADSEWPWPNLDYESPIQSISSSLECLVGEIRDLDVEESSPEDTLKVQAENDGGCIRRSTSENEIVSTATRYKHFVEKSLQLRGMRKVLIRLGDVIGKTLAKARRALEHPSHINDSIPPRPPSLRRSMPLLPAEYSFGDYCVELDDLQHNRHMFSIGEDKPSYLTPTTVAQSSRSTKSSKTTSGSTPSTIFGVSKVVHPELPRQRLIGKQFSRESDPELNKYGVHHTLFGEMALLSFSPSFLFLLRVPVDLVHEWLQLRVRQKTCRNPDPLTLKTLILDCHDCLDAAVEIKCFYQEYVQSTTQDVDQLDKLLVKDLNKFEEDLKEMYQTYLSYVYEWGVAQAQSETITADWSQTLMETLHEEWKFAKKIAINVLSGEELAARQFCQVSEVMVTQMVSEFLEKKCDYMDNELFDAAQEEDSGSEPSSLTPSLPSSLPHHHRLPSPRPSIVNALDCDNEEHVHIRMDSAVYRACRSFKAIITEVRERALRALAFAKLLRNDMEISAKFNRVCTQDELLETLYQNGYFLVMTPHFISSFMILCEKTIAENEEHLQLLLNVTCGRDEHEVPHHLASISGYLLLVKCDAQDKKNWKGPVTKITPDADTDVSLLYMQVDAVYLVVVNSTHLKSQLEAVRRHLKESHVTLVDEQCSCHELIASKLNQLKGHAMTLRGNIAKQIDHMSNDLLQEKEFEELENNERHPYRDTLIRAYDFAFEYDRELSKLVSAQFRPQLARDLSEFVNQWRAFVAERCEEGKGVKPRWALEGINFLALTLHPDFSQHLTQKEYETLKWNINALIQHIIGGLPGGVEERMTMEKKADGFVQFIHMGSPEVEGSGRRPSFSTSSLNTAATPASPRPSRSTSQHYDHDKDRMKRVQIKISELDEERNIQMKKQLRIGSVVTTQQVEAAGAIDATRTNFRWQRLNKKIGEGKFGVVHTAINLDTGMLMAVKQIRFERQDQRSMRMLYAEIKSFEAINHPNLVRYFGVEAHREELLIFMEYCDEGTLEKVCREGLDPVYVRQYTNLLLRGLIHLHNQRIIHRDIKPGNIFLTSSKKSEEMLKLGDFGSSVKMTQSTTIQGEQTDYVGTPAYMSPEVVTGGRMGSAHHGDDKDGYGRAADIWSVGCVVLEMATGKIIWKVGNGATPPVPRDLDDRCKDFLAQCFNADPTLRSKATQLIEHDFAKVPIGSEDS